MRSLITRSDDFGLNAATNAAICRAVDSGFIRNVSVLATAPLLDDAARALAGRGDVCFGLHADITAEWDSLRWGPVSDPARVPSLVRADGSFYQFVEELTQKGVSLDEIIAEYDAQWNLLREKGFALSYVDGHMAPDWLIPGLQERVRAWARHRGLRFVNPLTNLLPACQEMANVPDLFSETLAGLPDGVYIYIGHPAMDFDEMHALVNRRNPAGKAAAQRARDYRFAAAPETMETARRHQVRLMRYDEAYSLEGDEIA